VDFPEVAKNIFAGWAKSGIISLSPHETKKTTFLFETFYGKMSNFKILGPSLASPSHAHGWSADRIASVFHHYSGRSRQDQTWVTCFTAWAQGPEVLSQVVKVVYAK